MRRPLLLGIDLGTTAVKAGLYDRTGTAVGLARAAYPTSSHDALVEQNSEDWWQALRTALGRLATRADLAQVRSIGVVGQVNTHLCVDQELRPLGPAIVWQDQRLPSRAPTWWPAQPGGRSIDRSGGRGRAGCSPRRTTSPRA
jgi:xylulokinase